MNANGLRSNRDGGGVLCSGSIVYDILLRPVDEAPWGTTTFVDSLEYHVGGNGANTSLALALLGTPVRLAGAIGRDAQGDFILEQFRHAGVEIEAIELVDAPTATTVAMVNRAGDRKFLHRLGASTDVFAQPLAFTPRLLRGISHYHLASLFVLPRLAANAPSMLQNARETGLTTSVDVNWDPAGHWMRTLEPCLPYVDILFLNETEALMTTGTSDPAEGAACVLALGARVAAMKLGKRGCAIYTKDSEFLCPAYSVDVRDTTGAGDCFAAGFLAALLKGAPLGDAAQFANAVAAISVQRLGAVVGIPRYADVREWMSRMPVPR